MLRTVANGNGFSPPLNTLSRSDPNLDGRETCSRRSFTWTIMLINEPVEDEEAQFDLVEYERAMSMVGRDPNPPFRLLRVPEDLFLKTKQKIDDNVPGLPSTHGFLPPNSK